MSNRNTADGILRVRGKVYFFPNIDRRKTGRLLRAAHPPMWGTRVLWQVYMHSSTSACIFKSAEHRFHSGLSWDFLPPGIMGWPIIPATYQISMASILDKETRMFGRKQTGGRYVAHCTLLRICCQQWCASPYPSHGSWGEFPSPVLSQQPYESVSLLPLHNREKRNSSCLKDLQEWVACGGEELTLCTTSITVSQEMRRWVWLVGGD